MLETSPVTKVAVVGTLADIDRLLAGIGLTADLFGVAESTDPTGVSPNVRYVGHHNATVRRDVYDEIYVVSANHDVTFVG